MWPCKVCVYPTVAEMILKFWSIAPASYFLLHRVEPFATGSEQSSCHSLRACILEFQVLQQSRAPWQRWSQAPASNLFQRV
jgi:hypothetical protein